MQMQRLFEMVYLLLERGSVTAAEFAERFEVSVRTVYRDIDVLSGAGIPVYTCKGKHGGIRLLGGFTLDKSLFSEQEQQDILASLQGLSAIEVPGAGQALTKLAALFGKKRASWLDVDFSHWGGGVREREKFALLKQSILRNEVLSFDYYNAMGEKSTRTAEPLKLLFKGQGWYLYAFCRNKGGLRLFKLSRIKNLANTGEAFVRELPDQPYVENEHSFGFTMQALTLHMDAQLAYRVYDEFDEENILKNPDGSFTVTVDFPVGEWMYGYLLSYGELAEVVGPAEVRSELAARVKRMLALYE